MRESGAEFRETVTPPWVAPSNRVADDAAHDTGIPTCKLKGFGL
jgi:hypothetical protein